MSFKATFESYKWNSISSMLYHKSEQDVKTALHKYGKRDLNDFMALISPAAAPFLEEIASISQQITQRRFGKTIQLFAPFYLSNECKNICTYCGFSVNNQIDRLTLNEEQILSEIKAIKSLGIDHVLLVTGETPQVGLEYFIKALQIIRPHFSNISMEVQPLGEETYEVLMRNGVYSVLVYQETYGNNYTDFHPKGKKRNFFYRLDTADRLGKAGMHKIGLGCLIGLDDWRVDSWFTACHLQYLERTYWETKFSISFPRLRPAAGCITPKVDMSERELVQLICAYRIFNENVELSLSTRESQFFRDNVFPLGITSMSGGSKTDPGGYSLKEDALEQFEIEDSRSPLEIASMLHSHNYEAIWKDWDKSMG